MPSTKWVPVGISTANIQPPLITPEDRDGSGGPAQLWACSLHQRLSSTRRSMCWADKNTAWGPMTYWRAERSFKSSFCPIWWKHCSIVLKVVTLILLLFFFTPCLLHFNGQIKHTPRRSSGAFVGFISPCTAVIVNPSVCQQQGSSALSGSAGPLFLWRPRSVFGACYSSLSTRRC